MAVAKVRLQQLQKHFVLPTVDKAPHSFCIVCKPWYCKEIESELRSQLFVQVPRQEHGTFEEQINKITHSQLVYLA